jgi:flagellar hook-associated protein 2
VFQQQFKVGTGDYTRLTSIGAKTNTGTGEISLDRDALKTALDKNFDDVVKLFSTGGYSDVADVSHGNHSDETQSGVYRLEEVDANHFRIQLEGDTNWYLSEARSSDVISFTDGPAAGLSVTAPTGSVGAGASYTFSRGFGETLEGLARELTDGEKGLVALRQESWRKGIDRSNDRIDKFERSIEAYRLRLVNQFSHMEQVMSQMQSQQSNMMSQLGAM